MGVRKLIASWPVARQLGAHPEHPAAGHPAAGHPAAGRDRLALGAAAQSARSASLTARTDAADEVVGSICPYCAVGCAQRIYVKRGGGSNRGGGAGNRGGDRDGQPDRITQIEGDPASPVSRGRLCPKGSASRQLVDNPLRQYKVKYRRPYGEAWEELDLDVAMDMIAERVIKTRAETWQAHDPQGNTVKRTLGIASLGGATLDNEENYLMKKLYTALGAIQIENQARI